VTRPAGGLSLRLGGTTLRVRPGRPAIMGVVNANPGSFSDRVHLATPEQQFARAMGLVAAGADIIDVGTDSGVTYRAPRDIAEQLADVDGLVPLLTGAGVAVSIDTYDVRIAQRALEHGAVLINDVSGLADPEMARLAARYGAGLVVLHTRTAPKTVDYHAYRDVVEDVITFLTERTTTAMALGVARESIVIDPGIGYAKTPEDDLRVVRAYDRFAELGMVILSGVSRKYFAALVTGRSPDVCLPETLATLNAVRMQPGIVRVHDVEEADRFLRVAAVIDGHDPYPEYDIDDETSKWVRVDR
jgi:dihydropteroate synthase